MVFATNIFALDWQGVSYSDNARTYIDIDSIKKSNGFVYFWQLTDFNKERTDANITYISTAAYHMADCDIGRAKALSISFYSDSMAKGRPEESIGESKNWRFYTPGSHGAMSLDFACSFVKGLDE